MVDDGCDEEDAKLDKHLAGLDTGDIILFDRRCSEMSLFPGALCVCAKVARNVPRFELPSS